MIPTIDLSLWGALLAIGNLLAKVWEYATKAYSYLIEHVVLVIAGSKIWATFFFVGIAFILFEGFSTLIDFALDYFLDVAFSFDGNSVAGAWQEQFSFVGAIVPTSLVRTFISDSLTCFFACDFVKGHKAVVCMARDSFIALVGSWKT